MWCAVWHFLFMDLLFRNCGDPKAHKSSQYEKLPLFCIFIHGLFTLKGGTFVSNRGIWFPLLTKHTHTHTPICDKNMSTDCNSIVHSPQITQLRNKLERIVDLLAHWRQKLMEQWSSQNNDKQRHIHRQLERINSHTWSYCHKNRIMKQRICFLSPLSLMPKESCFCVQWSRVDFTVRTDSTSSATC